MQLTIEKIVWRGRGLSRMPEGKVVILDPGGLPGETVRARITADKKGHAEAVIEDILEPAPTRRPHPCPHGDICGGSRFGVTAYQEQLAIKRAMLGDCLSRSLPGATGRELLEGVATVPSPHTWGYRWRAQVQVRSGTPHYLRQSSHDLFRIQTCLLLADPLKDGLDRICSDLPDGRATVASSPENGTVRHHLDRRPIDLTLERVSAPLRLPAGVFFQANWSLNQELIASVCRMLEGHERIADLFAGAGNFALPLAASGHAVLGVESDARAVRAAAACAADSGLDKVRFKRSNLAHPREWQAVADFAPEAAVVDPPRSGGGKAVRALLNIPSLTRLVWVSCDAVNTCRDLGPFLEAGWRITSAALYDMFPQTWHLETVFVLER